MLAWSGLVVVGAAQTKVTTPEGLDQAMKKVGPASRAVPKALASGNMAEVKTQLEIMKQAFTDAENFWVINKRDDAVKFSKDTIGKVDAYITLASAATPDTAAIAIAAKEMMSSCGACHKVYRATDADNNYILRPGSIGGH